MNIRHKRKQLVYKKVILLSYSGIPCTRRTFSTDTTPPPPSQVRVRDEEQQFIVDVPILLRVASSNTALPVSATTRVGLKPTGAIAPYLARARVIYYRLFKYTQHTAGFIENHWAPHLLMAALATTIHYCISSLKCYYRSVTPRPTS